MSSCRLQTIDVVEQQPSSATHFSPIDTYIDDNRISIKPFTMSGAASTNASTSKANASDSKDTSQPQKPAAQLEEDDEFEDFPVEGTNGYWLVCRKDTS